MLVAAPFVVGLRFFRTDEVGAVFDAGVVDAMAEDTALMEGGASECSEWITIKPDVDGQYRDASSGFRAGHLWLYGPALVTGDWHVGADGTEQMGLGGEETVLPPPYFAAEYSIEELCSTEEQSATYLRIACIKDRENRDTVEYRLRDVHTVEIRNNTGSWAEYHGVQTFPKGACFKLQAVLPKRNLDPLQRAFLNDEPSDRCRGSTAPKRKEPAVFVHKILPKEDDRHGWGQLARHGVPPYERICRGVTIARLVIPPSVGPSEDLGTLGAQCVEPCHGYRYRHPNGASAECFEGGRVRAYQLGDYLYIVESSSVRRVPLACNVQLDFRLRDFVKPWGHGEPPIE